MNLHDARIALRTRTVLESLDLALRFTLAVAPRALFWLTTIVFVPALAFCVVARFFWEWSWVGLWVFAASYGIVTQGIFTVAAGRLMFAQAAPVREVLGAFARRSAAYLGAVVLTRVLIALGALVIIVAPLVWVSTAFVPEAVLLERASFSEALSRSSSFSRGHGGTTFALLCTLSAAIAAAIIAAEALGDGIVGFTLQLGSPLGSLFDEGGSLCAIAGYFLSVPLVAIGRFLAYIDARTRRDGWDVQVRFMDLAAAAAPKGEERAA